MKRKITCVGGGSYKWMPKLLNDIIQTNELENSEIVLLDINIKAAQDIKKVGEILCKKYNKKFQIIATTSEEKAFKDAQFVIITITTGGLEAMKNDLEIPEKYGIYQTVGDSVGPGGWSRTWRNVPVFKAMAEKIEKYSPKAFVLNYTNPMYSLTSIFYKTSNLRTVGLCHGLFETYDIFEKILKVKVNDIKVNFAGINHFFWILDFCVKGESGYPLLEKKLENKKIYKEISSGQEDLMGFHSGSYLFYELYKIYGYLTYAADRHTCEFFPNYLTGNEKKLEDFRLVKTSIKDREKKLEASKKTVKNIIEGKESLGTRSRETAIDIMKAIILDTNFIDIVNLPNKGQISNLPNGAIVETLGNVNALGFTPLVTGALPPTILSLIEPHILCQELLIEASLKRDKKLAIDALYMDPLCSYLSHCKIKEMGELLLKANEKYV
ncbi:MAG: hypothetical protein ABIB46_00675 [bacterium]